MLAPVDRPLDPAVAVLVGAPGGVEGEGWVGADGEGVAPGGVSPVAVVVVVVAVVVGEEVTNRLESFASSWIWIGCAHMVTGPVTCVLSSLTWRTVTSVVSPLANPLVHPAKVVSESLLSV